MLDTCHQGHKDHTGCVRPALFDQKPAPIRTLLALVLKFLQRGPLGHLREQKAVVAEAACQCPAGGRGIGSAGHLDCEVSTACIHHGSLKRQLTRNNSAERSSSRRVLAPDEADIVLPGDSAGALLAGGDRCGQREVRGLALPIPRVSPRHVLRHRDGGPLRASPVGVDHAGVRACALSEPVLSLLVRGILLSTYHRHRR